MRVGLVFVRKNKDRFGLREDKLWIFPLFQGPFEIMHLSMESFSNPLLKFQEAWRMLFESGNAQRLKPQRMGNCFKKGF